MNGIDWAAMHSLYVPLLPRIATRSEFGDILSCMLSELGTSHLYTSGGDYGVLDWRSHSQVIEVGLIVGIEVGLEVGPEMGLEVGCPKPGHRPCN